jgi:hypothetical protein
MSAQDDRVLEELALLRAMQFPSLPPQERAALLEEMGRIEDEYAAARAIEEDPNSEPKRRAYAKAVGDSIAKGLPDIVKGVAGAISAFQSGDNLAGSAAIMDICAAAAPIIAAVVGLAGPEGALVGALFSVVGQILRLFGPKQPSLKDQIAELLHELDSEAQLKDMEAVRLSLQDYDAKLTEAYELIAFGGAARVAGQTPMLRLPLVTMDDADDFVQQIEGVDMRIARGMSKFDIAEFENWKVAAWLKLPEKQDYPRWPEVLTVWCRTYSDLVNTRMKFICMVDPKALDEKIRFTREDNAKCPLPVNTRLTIHNWLLHLKSRVKEVRQETEDCNRIALQVLKAITPAAQGWGLHAAVGPDHGIYFVSGPGNAKSGKLVSRSDRNYYHRLALAAPRSGSAESYALKPRHHLLLLKSGGTGYPGDPGVAPGSVHDWMDYGRVRHFTYDIEDARFIQDGPHYHDVCAVETADRLDCWFGLPGGVQRGSIARTGDFKGAFAPGAMVATTAAPVDHVHAVGAVRDSVLPGDPDRDAVTWSAVGADDVVVYGGLRGSAEICVVALGGQHALPAPWPNYGGIASDRNFLWVFHRFGFACATHASVLAALQKPGRAVRWMGHDLPGRLQGRFTTDLHGNAIEADDPKATMYPENGAWANYWLLPGHREPVKPMPALKGLVSLGACDDGTLSACIVYREAHRLYDPTLLVWQAKEETRMYSTSYSVDVAAGALRVDDAWNLFPANTMGFRARKLPIPCWPLFSSLNATLALT